MSDRRHLFPLGSIVATPGALEMLTHEDIQRGLSRHVRGDWGALEPDDKRANDTALKRGERLLSAYHGRQGPKFWVITEANRSVTTVLLPEEY